nr:hypothetical protein [Tanacetum cinerariifolium]
MYDGEKLRSTKLKVYLPDYEETLEDAEKSRLKMKDKMIQLDFVKLNALYESFVHQTEILVEQNYFSSPSTSNVFSKLSKMQVCGKEHEKMAKNKENADSYEGGLDPISPGIRLPIEHGTNSGAMAEEAINTLTMEQYLASSRENQAPGVVKPEIRGNVNFEIKSRFIQELREETFSRNKNEDAHDHSYAEWYKENSHDNKPRPMDYSFKEWMIVKVGHTNVNKSVKKALLESWVIDCFEEALDPNKDPRGMSYDDYRWVFDLEIEQLAEEYELGIGKKGHMVEMIWENSKNI